MRIQKFFQGTSRWLLLFVAGMVVLVVSTLIVWQVNKVFISPSGGGMLVGKTIITLFVSDHDNSGTPKALYNSLTDPTTPDYSITATPEIPNTSGNLQMLRFQGKVVYKHKNENGRATDGKLTMTLPAKTIYTPDKLKFGSSEYTFDSSTPCFKISGTSTCSSKINVSKVSVAGAVDEQYKIEINFDFPESRNGALGKINDSVLSWVAKQGQADKVYAYAPPPATNVLLLARPYIWDFRLTFKQPINVNTVANLAFTVKNSGNSAGLSYTNSKLYGETRIGMTAKDGANVRSVVDNISLTQLIPASDLGQVAVNGNVGADEEVKNIFITSNSVVYGGSVSVSGLPLNAGGLPARLNWNTIKNNIDSIISKSKPKYKIDSNVTINNGVWYLNSNNGDKNSNNKDTYSSPPEGQLWRVNGNLDLTNATFSGAGTIIVNGNLTVNGNLSCSDGKRVGFIVTQSIIFKDGAKNIDCGAFISTSDNDIQVKSDEGNYKVILIAGGNITFESLAVGKELRINYDSVFAESPTVLFREILDLVFKTTS